MRFERLQFAILACASATIALSCRHASTSRQHDDERRLSQLGQWQSDSARTRRRVALGRVLFADANLSRDSTISCATCHIPSYGFAEPRRVSHGLGPEARKRNTPTLVNVSVFRTHFDWDGRASSLVEQLRGVFTTSGDMGIGIDEAARRVRDDPEYSTAFACAYGREADVDALTDALVAFQRTLVAADSRFARFYLGADKSALSEAEVRGWSLFRSGRSGCSGCHVPLPDPDGTGVLVFSDNRFHNLGVGFESDTFADVGRYAVTRNPLHLGSFRTPHLHNVAVTAPYMHDGSLATLEEVVDFYARGGNPNPNLDPALRRVDFTAQERADLVAFLRTLTVDMQWPADSATVGTYHTSPGGRPNPNVEDRRGSTECGPSARRRR